MLDAGGGGGGWGDGPTNFEAYSHEALKLMLDGARPADLTASGQELLDAKETLETLTTALETRISRLEWTGVSADNFRDWTGKVVVATRKFAEHSGSVGSAMTEAGNSLSFALVTMPEVPPNAKTIVDSNGEKRLVCRPGDTPDKKAMVESAKTELESARQEAIRRMESLGSSYTVTTETLTKVPDVVFPPLPALPAGSGGGGGNSGGGGGSRKGSGTVRVSTGKNDGTLIPGHGPSGDGGGGYTGGGGGGGGYTDPGGVGAGGGGGFVSAPRDTDLLGNGGFQNNNNGPTTTLPGPNGGPPGPSGPGGGPPNTGLPTIPAGGHLNLPPGRGIPGTPPGGKGRATLSSTPPNQGRTTNPTVGEPVSGGRPFGRSPMGGGGGTGPNNLGGGTAKGGAGGRRFTGQAGGVVGGTPRAGGAPGQFSSGGSGLGAGRGTGMRGGGMGAGTGGRDERNRRQRADYLHEEEETWSGNRTTAPPVVD